MNKIFITGNLTRDPDPIRTTSAGQDVCSFTVAVGRRYAGKGSEQTTDFFRVNAWRKLAKNCHDYLAKGKKVAIIGELDARTYTDKDGKTKVSLDITADEVEFLTPRGDPIASEPLPKMDDLSDIAPEDIPF